MSDRIRTFVLFSVFVCLAACGGGDGATSTTKCPEGMTSTANCAGKTDPTCPGSPLVAMCAGGQWSACACGGTSTMTSGQSTGGTMTGAVQTMTCGNGKAEGDEQCDGSDLKGMTCASLGMGNASAMLKCNARCAFDTLMCFSSSAAAPGGAGTGAGGTGARAMGAAGSGGSGR